MISIQCLFEDAKFDSVPKKFKKRLSRKVKNFKDFESSLPDMSYPDIGTQKFEEDLDEVRRCVKNPSLSKSFLNMANEKSEDIFKKLLDDEKIDWKKFEEICDDLDTVLLKLKFKHKRIRPFDHFEANGEKIKTKYAESPSFPSGHAAFAYFICDYFSHFYPEKAMQLQNLADMIGQSRIENGVHFPTDIQAGRYVGEAAARYLLQEMPEHGVNESKVDKNFVKFLRRRATTIRSSFKKTEAIDYYLNDMAEFVSLSSRSNFNECYNASKSLLEGMPIKYCSDNEDIKNTLKSLNAVFNFKKIEIEEMNMLNKITESASCLRREEKMILGSIRCCPVSRIEEKLTKINEIKQKPFLKMALFRWVSPFESGNKKISDLIVLKETGFNFDITVQILSEEMNDMLEDFYLTNEILN